MGTDAKYERLLKRMRGNIKRIRQSKQITQEEMVDYGFNYRHYQSIESGRHSPNLHTLFRVAEAFKVDVRDFF